MGIFNFVIRSFWAPVNSSSMSATVCDIWEITVALDTKADHQFMSYQSAKFQGRSSTCSRSADGARPHQGSPCRGGAEDNGDDSSSAHGGSNNSNLGLVPSNKSNILL
jgi:hypothetical protein